MYLEQNISIGSFHVMLHNEHDILWILVGKTDVIERKEVLLVTVYKNISFPFHLILLDMLEAFYTVEQEFTTSICGMRPARSWPLTKDGQTEGQGHP